MVTSPASRRRLAALAVVVALGGAACASDAEDAAVNNDVSAANATTTTAPPPTAAPVEIATPDIVGTALRAGVFTQLAGMVVDAGLVETLRGGTFTVFAPTDSAFDKVPQSALDQVQDNPDTLKTVLTYHVVPGVVKAADLKDGDLMTVAGVPLKVSHSGSDVLINGSKIAKSDIQASNGIVHVMGDVLLPPG